MVAWRRASLLIPLGGVLLLISGGWLLLTPAQQQEIARVAALPVRSPAEVTSAAPGLALLLEGKLAARGTVSPQGFVVYSEQYFLRRESEGANRGREQWGDRSVTHPTLTVELDGASIETCDGDYRLARPPHTWQSDVALRSGDLFHDATIRRFGFRGGDAVTLDGRVGGGAGKPCFDAEVLFGGTPAAYLEQQRSGQLALRIVGAVFSGLGAVLLVVTAVWRSRRRVE